MNGQGVAKDPAAAVEWFRKSAEQRLPSAQFVLGQVFCQGDGVTKDLAEGTHWYRRTIANPETTADMKQQAQKRLKDLGMQP
jgi:TPR repeat protein